MARILNFLGPEFPNFQLAALLLSQIKESIQLWVSGDLPLFWTNTQICTFLSMTSLNNSIGIHFLSRIINFTRIGWKCPDN